MIKFCGVYCSTYSDVWYWSSEPSCSALLIWSQITVKWMISDNLDTSGMMKCHSKVNQEPTRVSPISSATCTNLGLSCFRHPVNSCQKSPNQPWQGPVKVLKYHQLYHLLAHVPKGRFQDGNLVRPSPTENKAWCKPNPNHFSIQVVPGQMVSERIGLKNGIVLSFSS
jgi:hypothetical protein